MKKISFIVVFFSLMIIACKSSAEKEGIATSFKDTPEALVIDTTVKTQVDSNTTPALLIGKWELKEVRKEKGSVKPQVPYFIEFLEESIAFNLDCNNCFSGKYEISDSTINVGIAACTKKGCPPVFNKLRKELDYQGSYEVNDSLFTIFSKNGTALKFQKVIKTTSAE